jgi:hypothetical protein
VEFDTIVGEFLGLNGETANMGGFGIVAGKEITAKGVFLSGSWALIGQPHEKLSGRFLLGMSW